jgi:hypothetical protein
MFCCHQKHLDLRGIVYNDKRLKGGEFGHRIINLEKEDAMKRRGNVLIIGGVVICLIGALVALPLLGVGCKKVEKPIVIGCPLSTAFVYGWDAERGIRLAVE